MADLTPRAFLQDLRQHARAFAVLAYVALALTLCEYLFLSTRMIAWFPEAAAALAPAGVFGSFERAALMGYPEPGPWWGVLVPQAWWTGGTLLLWVVVPLTACRFAGYAFSDLGLSARGFVSKLWLYGLLFLVMMPGVLWAATQEGFLQTYPFLRPQHCARWCWLVLACYWGIYALQFVAVEFFFRGFTLFVLEKDFGPGAIAVMAVPYCMIHYHKPLPEALGAIVAGVVLGWLALRTRSIWGGVMLHVAVALSMDALSLWRAAAFPQSWF